jgi:hypothetical protein
MKLFLSNQVESRHIRSGLVFAFERFTESMMTTTGEEKRLKDQKNISESRGELEDVFFDKAASLERKKR